MLATMSAESNNQICRHSNPLFGVTAIVADAEEVAVEALEALGSNVAQYATHLAYYITMSARRSFCTRRSLRLGLIARRGAVVPQDDRPDGSPLYVADHRQRHERRGHMRSRQGGVVCRRIMEFLSAARIMTMLRGLELRVHATNLHRCGTVINHLIECIILLGKTSEDVGDYLIDTSQTYL
jgi:hypothetical protein